LLSKYGDTQGRDPVIRPVSIIAARCERLALDVGDDGIIGRGCSVMKDGERWRKDWLWNRGMAVAL